MKIKLDLRPEKTPRKTINTGGLSRFIAFIIVFAFIAVSGLTLVYAGLKFHYMKASILSVQNNISRLQTQDTRLSKELDRLKAEENNYNEALKLLESELPTLEFLSLLENALPEGVWLDSMQIKPGNVSLKGRAYGENDVVLFAKALSDSRLVGEVSFPDTSRGRPDADGISVVSFSFSCQIATITDIPVPSRGGVN